MILFEDLQYAEVGKTTREPAAQSEAQTCTFRRVHGPAAQGGMEGTRHARRMPAISLLPNGPCVLKKQYVRTSVSNRHKFSLRKQAVPPY